MCGCEISKLCVHDSLLVGLNFTATAPLNEKYKYELFFSPLLSSLVETYKINPKCRQKQFPGWAD